LERGYEVKKQFERDYELTMEKAEIKVQVSHQKQKDNMSNLNQNNKE